MILQPGGPCIPSRDTSTALLHVAGGLSLGRGFGWVNTNLRTRSEKVVRRAGLVPWPRPSHNLRASCETDPMRHHPIYVVMARFGNTPKAALGRYLQTPDRDFGQPVRGEAGCGARPCSRRPP